MGVIIIMLYELLYQQNWERLNLEHCDSKAGSRKQTMLFCLHRCSKEAPGHERHVRVPSEATESHFCRYLLLKLVADISTRAEMQLRIITSQMAVESYCRSSLLTSTFNRNN